MNYNEIQDDINQENMETEPAVGAFGELHGEDKQHLESESTTMNYGLEMEPTDDDEDKGNICRVCRMGSEPGRTLFYPCKCSGSIKYIHEGKRYFHWNQSRYVQYPFVHCTSSISSLRRLY